MRLAKLHLQAFGPFTDRVLDFGSTGEGLVLVHGLNEAGKSSVLRAISDLRFGIHAQSSDNFLHAHADLRIGGEFIDHAGVSHSFMRRKGRGDTLLQAAFGAGAPIVGNAASIAHEALLTAGLSRDAYETMFAMDHQRLRLGGKALLKGDGDVGAALFEASAGVRSIPQVLEQLDESARKYFMPGARGRNARINQALASFEEHNDSFKQNLVRPMQWTSAFKLHQAEKTELARFEAIRSALAAELLLVKELRAAAPLLAVMDSASHALEQLAASTMLPENASTERAAAESGVLDAQHNVVNAVAEADRQTLLLATLLPDARLLAAAPAIRRLEASAESLDQYRRDIAEAQVDANDAKRIAEAIALKIAPNAKTENVVANAPSKSSRADIEATIRKLDNAQRVLEQHTVSAWKEADGTDDVIEPLPVAEMRVALQVAQENVVRNDTALQRLKALPTEIRSAERTWIDALNALRLSDEVALAQIRPMLPAQIDLALKEESDGKSGCDGLQLRIQDILKALPLVHQREQALSVGSALATRDDVGAARLRRDQGWEQVRSIYIDRTVTSEAGHATSNDYADAVREADRVVDVFASDTARAAQLEGVRKEISVLEGDREQLQKSLGELDAANALRNGNWYTTLTHGGLPGLAPSALREWHGLLPAARQALDQLKAKQDDLASALELEHTLASGLATALNALKETLPAGTSLAVLTAMASTLEQTYRQRQRAIDAARGEQQQKERDFKQRAEHLQSLKLALKKAEALVAPMLEAVYLPLGTSVEVAYARLVEFDDLLAADANRATADVKEQRAQQALKILIDNVEAVRNQLSDTPSVDMRAYVDDLVSRLDVTLRTEAARALAQHGLSAAQENQKAHQSTLAQHQATLTALCVAAAVDSAAMLPEAEENSRRKREAILDIDKARKHLTAVTSRDEQALRKSLVDWDATGADAQEAALAYEQSQADEHLKTTRIAEESARREVEAIDSSDITARAREAMEHTAARVRSDMAPWIRSKLAHALLAEALKRFRERAQGPMLRAATTYFAKMTGGEFDRLVSDDTGREPVLMAQRRGGSRLIGVHEMSEGTRDQLYLALRLAALELQRKAGLSMPVLLDDVLMTSDEERSAATLDALAEFSKGTQVVVFTHHDHVAQLAAKHVSSDFLTLVSI